MFSRNAATSYQTYGDFSKLWEGEGLAQALEIATALEQQGSPVSKDFVRCILQGCLKKKDLRAGKQAHTLIIACGLFSHDFLAAELIRLFAACHCLPAATQVFHNLPSPSLYTCNAMISAQVFFSKEEVALCVYDMMCMYDTKPDKITYLHTFKACSNAGYAEKGRLIHGDTIRCDCQYDSIVGCAIIDMYVKCGMLEDARKVFDDLPERDAVTWGAMIAGHALHGSSLQALHLFMRMQERGHKPNQFILASVLTACGNIGTIQQGRLIHDQIVFNSLHSDMVLGNTLVDMYVKCGSMDEACNVFHGLPARDLATWSSLISGYAQQGDGFPALQLFDQLTEKAVKLDKITYLCLLKACSSVGAVLHGMQIHEKTIKNGLDRDQVVGSSLVDMYVKCGYLKEAFKVFSKLVDPDVILCGTMLLGLAQAGDWSSTMSLFQDMHRRGMQPDGATFTIILKACSQSSQSSEAYIYFKSMRWKHSIVPDNEQYSCMLDLLSRAGQLHDAQDLLNTLPMSCNIMQATSLLTSCRTYSDVKLGRQCFDHVLEIDPNNAIGDLPTSNIYAV